MLPVNNSSTKEEKIAEIKVLKEKKICGCGSVITDLIYPRHCTTKKHQKYLEKNQEIFILETLVNIVYTWGLTAPLRIICYLRKQFFK